MTRKEWISAIAYGIAGAPLFYALIWLALF